LRAAPLPGPGRARRRNARGPQVAQIPFPRRWRPASPPFDALGEAAFGTRRDRLATVTRARGPGGGFGRPGESLARPRLDAPAMELSTRNQLPGTVKSVTLGAIMAEVAVDVGGFEVVSAITAGARREPPPPRG